MTRAADDFALVTLACETVAALNSHPHPHAAGYGRY